MSIAVVVALIHILPSLLWVLLAVSFVALLYRPLRYELIPRMTGIEIFGVEATFVREEMNRAIAGRSVHVSDVDRSRVLRRLRRLRDVFREARILWLDPAPEERAGERAMLRFTGALVDPARSGEDALRMLAESSYDAVVSAEPSPPAAPLLAALQAGLPRRQVIVYAASPAPDRAPPPGAVALTDRPDELLHCVADALERSRL